MNEYYFKKYLRSFLFVTINNEHLKMQKHFKEYEPDRGGEFGVIPFSLKELLKRSPYFDNSTPFVKEHLKRALMQSIEDDA